MMSITVIVILILQPTHNMHIITRSFLEPHSTQNKKGGSTAAVNTFVTTSPTLCYTTAVFSRAIANSAQLDLSRHAKHV